MWINPAYAQEVGGAGEGLIGFLPLILIFVVFYFLLIRPQQKKMKEHKAMLQAVRRGDRVVTGGGIIANVTKVNNEKEVTVEIAPEIKVRVVRDTLQQILEKKGGSSADEPDDDAAETESKAS